LRHLIAFVGFKSSGKNTAAEALYPYGFVPLSFADAIKDTLAAIFCWDRAMLEGITPESRAWREQVDAWWAAKLGIPHFTPRWAMMNVGTEVMRKHIHSDLWVFNVVRRIILLDEATSVVLIDARFLNEIALAHQFDGQVIRIQRGPDPDWMDLAVTANTHPSAVMRQHATSLLTDRGIHSSEFGWIGGRIDATIINDGTIADLHRAVIKYRDERYAKMDGAV
jgi:hypothetical protein